MRDFSGTVIENLCETAFESSRNDRSAVVRAARCLLSSVTRVLLLADSVVVKQLLHAKEKVRFLWDVSSSPPPPCLEGNLGGW